MAYYGFFQDFIYSLESLGISDVLLPFFLIFILSYLALQQLRGLSLFSNKRSNVVLAIIIGLAVVIPHVTGAYPAGYDVVEIINAYLPNIGLILVALFGILILLGLIGFKVDDKSNVKNITAVILVLIAIYLFLSAAGFDWPWLIYIDPETISFVIALIIFGLIVYYITKDDESNSGGQQQQKQSGGGGGNP